METLTLITKHSQKEIAVAAYVSAGSVTKDKAEELALASWASKVAAGSVGGEPVETTRIARSLAEMANRISFYYKHVLTTKG